MLGRMSRLAYLTSRIPCASQLFRDKETKTPRGWLCQHCIHGPRRGSEAAQAEEEGGDRDKWQALLRQWRHSSSRSSKYKCSKHPLSRSKPPAHAPSQQSHRKTGDQPRLQTDPFWKQQNQTCAGKSYDQENIGGGRGNDAPNKVHALFQDQLWCPWIPQAPLFWLIIPRLSKKSSLYTKALIN